MKKQILLIMLITAFLIFPSFGEEKQSKSPENGVGVMAGLASGFGISYQKWFGDIGMKATGVAYTGTYYGTPAGPDNNGTDAYISQEVNYYSAGIEGMYKLFGHEPTDWLSGNLYLVGGCHYGNVFTPLKPGFVAGFGFGIETIFFKHWAISFELLETMDFNTLTFVVLPQGGFHFKF